MSTIGQYHLSVALFSITLELFEEVKHRTAESESMRAEVHGALPILEQMRVSSSIADRGLTLVMPLLEEERRLKEEADKRRPSRKVSFLDQQFSDVVYKAQTSLRVQNKAADPASASASTSANPSVDTSPRTEGSSLRAPGFTLPALALTNQHQSSSHPASSPSNSETVSDRGGPLPTPDAMISSALPPFFADFGDETWLDATLSGGPIAAATPLAGGLISAPSHLPMMPPFAMYPPYIYGYPGLPNGAAPPLPAWDARWNGPQE